MSKSPSAKKNRSGLPVSIYLNSPKPTPSSGSEKKYGSSKYLDAGTPLSRAGSMTSNTNNYYIRSKKPLSSKHKSTNTSACYECQSVFATTGRNPHHCRYCGQCICGSCSTWTINGLRCCISCIKKEHISQRCGCCKCLVCTKNIDPTTECDKCQVYTL